MIKSWKHKGLKRYYQTGNKSGIQPAHAKRLKLILQLLNAAIKPSDMDLPGMKFHPLLGEMRGFYSVMVNGNWRVVFSSDGEDMILVDYDDYH